MEKPKCQQWSLLECSWRAQDEEYSNITGSYKRPCPMNFIAIKTYDAFPGLKIMPDNLLVRLANSRNVFRQFPHIIACFILNKSLAPTMITKATNKTSSLVVFVPMRLAFYIFVDLKG